MIYHVQPLSLQICQFYNIVRLLYVYINYYISRDLYEMLQEYAERKGQTGTMAIERILRKFFEEESQIRVEKMEMK